MKRIHAGLYEHTDTASGTTWRVCREHGEIAGVDRWVYSRSDDEAWRAPDEAYPQDVYPTKRAAVEALADRLENRK